MFSRERIADWYSLMQYIDFLIGSNGYRMVIKHDYGGYSKKLLFRHAI